ncbi:MAG: AsmA-like C-terminal region-containing protein [Kiritimatiellae bacterium]|nr:AsmA-like C-terminal region-containing protein [Kiritimatiellia bacterium]
MKKALSKILKFFSKAMLCFFIVFVLFFGSLFFREQRLPRFIVDLISESLSNENFAVDCGGVYFSFCYGLRLQNISLVDTRLEDSFTKPVASAKDILYDFINDKLVIHNLEYKRLPDSYYSPQETDAPFAPLECDLPNIKNLEVVLISPNILGLTPDKVLFTVKTSAKEKKILVDNAEVVLPGQDCDTIVNGNLIFDFESQILHTKMRGAATQRQIRPLLETLDLECALPYMDAFTDIPKPIEADCEIIADVFNGDFSMFLDLDVKKMGKYNSVPMAFAKGGIQFHSKINKGNLSVVTKVFVSSSEDYEGRTMSGWLTIDNFSGRFKVNYDVKSGLKIDDSLKIADFMDPALLSFVNFDSSSLVTIAGYTGTVCENSDLNNICGDFKSDRGSFDGFNFVDLTGRYSLKEDVVSIDTDMNGADGGKVKFSTSIFCEKFDDEKAHFKIKGSYRDGSLKELADALSFDLGDRKGDVSIDLDISGDFSTNIWKTVNGKGRIAVTNGHLARMKLFSGLTELLAERVPGVAFLVDQTQASADVTFENGVLTTKNLFIDGGIISIKGWGSYDIAKDNLDFVVRVQFTKEESIAGKIVHYLTIPFTKLLLEFKVIGPIDNPRWENIQIIDRIL